MRRINPYALLLCAAILIAITASADAGDESPDSRTAYRTRFLEMKPGYALYRSDGARRLTMGTPEGVRSIVIDIGDEQASRLRMEEGSRLISLGVAEIRTVDQARELCELVMQGGAVVEDAESFKKLLKIHRKAGYDLSVEDNELVFEPVAKAVTGGFRIEFTAFYEPQTMGAQSVVARFDFLVKSDASFTVRSTPYLKGMFLNWQTGVLDTPEKREQEAQAVARVERFLEECYKRCSTRLPREPKDAKQP